MTSHQVKKALATRFGATKSPFSWNSINLSTIGKSSLLTERIFTCMSVSTIPGAIEIALIPSFEPSSAALSPHFQTGF